jgi:hypothetical protein
MATGLAGLTACKESTSPAALFSTTTVTTDVAASTGDAVATAVETMTGNETGAALPAPGVGFDLFGSNGNVTVNRSRTCYDASNAVVAGCTPIASVRKIVTHVTLDGSRSGTNTTTGGSTVTFTGAVHRVADDTLRRNFNTAVPPVDTSRTHTGLQTSHDTTTFSNPPINRTHVEAAVDSVIGVTFLLPRTTHPYPVSGHITRIDSVTATFTNGTRTETRSLVKMITVTFPADGQGNVPLAIDGKACTLNLVTHKVAGC